MADRAVTLSISSLINGCDINLAFYISTYFNLLTKEAIALFNYLECLTFNRTCETRYAKL